MERCRRVILSYSSYTQDLLSDFDDSHGLSDLFSLFHRGGKKRLFPVLGKAGKSSH